MLACRFMLPSRTEVLRPALFSVFGFVFAWVALATFGTAAFLSGAAVFGAGAGLALPRWIRSRACKRVGPRFLD